MLKKRILILDDFKISNEVLSNFFKEPDFDIFCCQSPEEAIRYLELNEVDLVITDYEMPGMNGVELINKIRNITKLSRIPVIIVSGINKQEIKQLAFENNVTAWIDKPITAEKAERIRNFLKSQ